MKKKDELVNIIDMFAKNITPIYNEQSTYHTHQFTREVTRKL